MAKTKILIIEDNPELSEMYTLKFERAGYTVTTAIDGEQGIHKAVEVQPDIVLLDVLMPHMNGFDVLKVIRDNTNIRVPLIVLSNLSQQEQIDQAYNLGATSYLVKANYTPTEVVTKIKELLPDLVPTDDAPPTGVPGYRLQLTPGALDYNTFMGQLPQPLPTSSCDACSGHLVLELLPNQEKQPGTWFSAHFICHNCGKQF